MSLTTYLPSFMTTTGLFNAQGQFLCKTDGTEMCPVQDLMANGARLDSELNMTGWIVLGGAGVALLLMMRNG